MHKNANDLKVLKELKIQDNPKEEEGVKKEDEPKIEDGHKNKYKT